MPRTRKTPAAPGSALTPSPLQVAVKRAPKRADRYAKALALFEPAAAAPLTPEAAPKPATWDRCAEYYAADEAWQIELEYAFPERPTLMRYRAEGQGFAGTPLRAAYDRFIAAQRAYRNQ